ncbi:MAG: glycosyltransferase family 4 protein, partial [Verrucomicrobia bacterium]|nr:glycosyltransferase family 4 protein [Verrucomicrobiota bacterium]
MPPAPRRPWRIVHSECSLGWGGQEHRVLAELEGFKRRGCAVWLLAPREAGVFKRARAAGIATHPLGVSRPLFPFTALALAGWLRRNRIEIVNTHSSRDGWLVGVAARLARVPLIIRTRHFEVPIADLRLSRLVYERLADHLITTSTRITSQFQNAFGFSSERVSTISTGIDVDRFSPRAAKAELPTRHGQEEWPLVGMVAVLRHAKGHVILVRAARMLRDWGIPVRLVLVGEGPSKQPIEAELVKLDMVNCATFTGHRDDIPNVLRALNVLVIPSLHEGVPQAGLQALACGTPVVGSDTGGIPEIIRHGETGRIFKSG